MYPTVQAWLDSWTAVSTAWSTVVRIVYSVKECIPLYRHGWTAEQLYQPPGLRGILLLRYEDHGPGKRQVGFLTYLHLRSGIKIKRLWETASLATLPAITEAELCDFLAAFARAAKSRQKRIRLFKGTVAPVWVWLKVVWLESAKTGEEPLSVFKIFHSSCDF
jgi:hypothetical protein